MNILIISGHPAQVHNFRILKNELELKGHKVFWIATNKDISEYLLKKYSIDHDIIEKPGKSILLKIHTLVKNTKYCLKFLKTNNIDIIISRVSPYAALAGFLKRISHIAIADTESSGIYNKVFAWLSSAVLTPKSFQRKLGSDQIRFDGNIELFYLHPRRFRSLDNCEVAKLLGIEPMEIYIIMRFVSWDAYHDKGLTGFSDDNKLKAVKLFSKYGRVFISSEKTLFKELEQYQIKIPPEKMHDLLKHAKLFFGESATMASESAVLGTPAIYLDKAGRGYTDEEQQYDLVYNYSNNPEEQEKSIEKGVELLRDPDLKYKMQKSSENFLKDKIDVTAFFVWFIENWPESNRIMQEDPDYQYRFK